MKIWPATVNKDVICLSTALELLSMMEISVPLMFGVKNKHSSAIERNWRLTKRSALQLFVSVRWTISREISFNC
jgi:hypothetical protein